MRYVLAGALYLLAATVSAGPAEDAVATLDAFHRALAVGDRDGARARLSQQVIIYEAGIGEYGIEAYAAHHLGADIRFSAATKSQLEHRTVKALGDGFLILSEKRVTGEIGGRSIARRTAETALLMQAEPGWRIRHLHWSSRPAR